MPLTPHPNVVALMGKANAMRRIVTACEGCNRLVRVCATSSGERHVFEADAGGAWRFDVYDQIMHRVGRGEGSFSLHRCEPEPQPPEQLAF